MADTGFHVFDETLVSTVAWLDEVEAALGADRQAAWHALGAVLRTLRDRVPVGLAAHLGAQLPLLLRGAYYEAWHPTQPPERMRSLGAFAERIRAELPENSPVEPGEAMRAVFRVIAHRVDPGQVTKLVDVLPDELREVWREVAVVRSKLADAAGAENGAP
ncbi:DUF2267 domain-containing protein [Roseomonas sp. BN140053]|uniref:DUF2267 domain-containing protein n=1 Tax=Roseomonas sp. BN140053 TaxID=3391898 RepID=UPI0039E8D56A